jgi:hypothetical protein
VATAWQGVAFSRAIILFALQMLVPTLLSFFVQTALEQRHVPQAPFWANALSVVLLLPVVQALCTLVYLDLIGYESKRTCSR